MIGKRFKWVPVMRGRVRHIAGTVLLGLALAACQNSTVPPETALAQQDSLIAMIDQKIAAKEQQRRAVEEFRRRQLPKNFGEQIRKYLPVIRKYASRYQLDWRLIIAQILKESYFKEDALSNVGARGLMQIMPRTAREITQEIDIAYITKDPRENITAGIYYLFKQLQNFPEADPDNRLKLALAAYNCGVARIYDAQDIARFKELDPFTWEAVKECLPLLTSDHWQLHLEVWKLGTPSFGYFYGYEETIDYVDDIMVKYRHLKQMYKNNMDNLAILEELNATM